jgi:hypothetical protein
MARKKAECQAAWMQYAHEHGLDDCNGRTGCAVSREKKIFVCSWHSIRSKRDAKEKSIRNAFTPLPRTDALNKRVPGSFEMATHNH